MGATGPAHLGVRPRIRRRLRLIAVGLVLLPMLAIAYLVKSVAEADEKARARDAAERREALERGTGDLARALARQGSLFPGESREYYTLRRAAPPLRLAGAIDVDGVCADWRAVGGVPTEPCSEGSADGWVSFDRPELLAEHRGAYDPRDFSFALLTGERDSYLYLFVRVRDDDLLPRSRRLDSGDQLRLVVAVADAPPVRFVVSLEPGDRGAVTTYQVDRSFEREVPARERVPWGDYHNPVSRRPYGAWRPTAEGYDLELRLPLRTLGPQWREAELGLAVVDADRGPGPSGREQRILWAVPQDEGVFALRAPGAEAFERAWADLDPGLRQRPVAVFDARGRELYSGFLPLEPRSGPLHRAADELLAELAHTDTASRALAAGAIAGAVVPGERGGVMGAVLEHDPTPPGRPRLAALLRESPVTGLILGGSLAFLFALLVYTRRLSHRILALVDDVAAERDADDEIGELSRRLSELVERVQADRDYLERLPGILGHETLGPLGVVRMFVDDLEQRGEGHGLRHAAARRAIRSIEELIEDLREATSLEEALARGEPARVDLVELLRDYAAAWAEGSGVALQVDLPEASFPTTVIEGRVEQLLDKLLDNAAEFSGGDAIRLAASCERDAIRIRVENHGPPLPEGPATEKLFEPMWSDRKRTAERHLGMGLYVARVIAEHHGGAIRAWNAEGGRVVFEVTLPRKPA